MGPHKSDLLLTTAPRLYACCQLTPTLVVQTLKLTRYQDLSEWHLCASEQKELCKNLIDSGLSVNAWSSRHSMNYSSMKRYMRKYQLWQSSGIDTFHNSGGGRPPIIDDTGIINIRKNLRENLASQSCQQSMITQFHLRVETEAAETRKRRGVAGSDIRV